MFRLPIRLMGLHPANRPPPCRLLGINTPATNNINSDSKNTTNGNNQKASLEQLARLEQRLTVNLPKFFARPHDLTMYTRNIKLIDNIRGTKAQGLGSYAWQIGLIKIYHYINYTSLKVELLNLVKNPEESCIKIRWRIIAKPGLTKLILNFWRIKSLEIWKDGISTMHVNNSGLIHTHVCDNIDYETKEADAEKKIGKSIKNPLVNRGLNV